VTRYLCVDFGSTFTKAVAVDSAGGLIARAEHRTTLDTDLIDGWLACRERLLDADPVLADAEVLACSSAGGGLRIAVVGNEELVTAEAGRRVALSSGGRVVTVVSGGLTATSLKTLRSHRPDVVLLVGGTDGGNSAVITEAARVLAAYRWRRPVVAAGNVEAKDEVARLLDAAAVPHVVADNVVPEIGVFAPESARAAIREMFLRHVIGGKKLSRHPEFQRIVRAATPDAVLAGVEVLAKRHGDVAVVDVGGATTDVHSVVEVDPDDDREVVATHPVTRTVEGDLGMRWNAEPVVDAGLAAGLVAGLVGEADVEGLRAAARRRHDVPGFVPETAAEAAYDESLATVAVTIAVRRHAGRRRIVFGPDGRVVERSGKDLREVDLLVGSGGVLRHNDPEVAHRVLAAVTVGAEEEGWLVPRAARVTVDRDYVLAAAGLLADIDPAAATGLVSNI
jgi:uncharacterized protein (TIGR01319 family)